MRTPKLPRFAVLLALVVTLVTGLVAAPLAASAAPGNGNGKDEPPPPAQSAWTTTGGMITPRGSHSMTPLADGTALAAGGRAQGTVLDSAEMYNPATGTWTATGSMTTARASHTAVRLDDGRVLVIGGDLATAEIYNPATGTWTATGSMTTNRSTVFAAALLPDGRVIVSGGDAGGPDYGLATAEIYNPATGTWTPTGSMTTSRVKHTAVTLADGRVLVAGGQERSIFQTSTDTPPALRSAEIYNPATGTWSGAGNITTDTGRTNLGATRLTDGRVLVTGGQSTPACGLCGWLNRKEASLFNPDTGSWTAAASMNEVSRQPTLLPDGTVLVFAAQGPEWGAVANAEIYHAATNEWTLTDNPPVSGGSMVLLGNGTALVAGGDGPSAIYTP